MRPAPVYQGNDGTFSNVLERAGGRGEPSWSSAQPAQYFLFSNFTHPQLQVFFRGAIVPRGRHRLEWLISADVLYLKVE